jgi:hypothetical protein
MSGSIKIYPEKIYTTLARACRYGNVLPNYVQPVFREYGGLMHERIGFAIGSPAVSFGIGGGKRCVSHLSYCVKG